MKKNTDLSEKELTHTFNLLKHPIRREILRQLAESPQSYSQILKNLGIQDSSLLNYHLREMRVLLIDKDVSGKYKLNEVGKICSQLVSKIKEKENINRFNKLQILIIKLRSIINIIQITFSVLVIFLILELFWRNIFDLSTFLDILIPAVGFSIPLSFGVFLIAEKSENTEINKLGKKEKLGIFSTFFTIWILVQTIIKLFW